MGIQHQDNVQRLAYIPGRQAHQLRRVPGHQATNTFIGRNSQPTNGSRSAEGAANASDNQLVNVNNGTQHINVVATSKSEATKLPDSGADDFLESLVIEEADQSMLPQQR